MGASSSSALHPSRWPRRTSSYFFPATFLAGLSAGFTYVIANGPIALTCTTVCSFDEVLAIRRRGIIARTLPSMRRIGHRWSIAHALWLSARADRLEGRATDARRVAAESLELRRQIDDRYGEAESIVAEADALALEGCGEQALVQLREARAIRLAIGDRVGIMECDVALESRRSK